MSSNTARTMADVTAAPATPKKRASTPRDTDRPRAWDSWLLFAGLCLLGVGAVMVYSASAGVAAMEHDDPFLHMRKHLVHIAAALFVMMVGIAIPYATYRRFVYLILAVSVTGLVLTLMFGVTRNYSTRWLSVAGIEIQMAEMAKLAFVFWMAYSIDKKQHKIRTFSKGWVPHLLVATLFALLCLGQPDLGTCIVLGAVLFAMLFVAGSPLVYPLIVGSVVIPLGLMYIATSNNRMERVMAWIDPWEDRLGIGYQTTQALMSHASGGWLGLGLGNGRQKMGFLTQSWTDFIFASIGEELGFVGCAGVALLFGVILWRGLRIALRARDVFGRMVALGVTVLLVFQAVFNMGVAVALVPTKGLNLPFVSGGGSSLLVTCFALGVLLNVSRYVGVPAAAPRKKARKAKTHVSDAAPAARKRKHNKEARKPITQRQSGVVPFTSPGGSK